MMCTYISSLWRNITNDCSFSELDKAIAHAAIEEETRYSVCAEEAFRLYLKTRREKETWENGCFLGDIYISLYAMYSYLGRAQ